MADASSTETPSRVALAPGLTAHLEHRSLLLLEPIRSGFRLERRGLGQVVLARSLSLVLFVVGVIFERWDLAGEQTPVLGIPVDRFE